MVPLESMLAAVGVTVVAAAAPLAGRPRLAGGIVAMRRIDTKIETQHTAEPSLSLPTRRVLGAPSRKAGWQGLCKNAQI